MDRSTTASSSHLPVLMQQSINRLTGQPEWTIVHLHHDSEGLDSEIEFSGKEVSEALIMTTYLDMVNDATRNRAYNLAIQKAVIGARHVLDIGAGTGLLSMMAWRAICNGAQCRSGEELCSVTACESFLPMFKLARRVFQANKVGAGVRLIYKRSDEMEVGMDMHCRADVLISEILDSELLGEGLIPTLRHAHQNLLTPNARCVPHKATIYAQLVECDHLWRCHDLPGVESELADGLVLSSCECTKWQGRSAAIHVDSLASQIKLVSVSCVGQLSGPFEVFTFELAKAPDEFGQRQHSVFTTNMGRAHALISWWVLQLDIEGQILYSTAPKWIQRVPTYSGPESAPLTGHSEWCDHWKQVVWFLPGKEMLVSEGEEVIITAIHDSLSVKYSVVGSREGGLRNDIFPRSPCSIERPVLHEAFMTLSRIGVLGNKSWRETIRTAAEIALRCQQPSLCVVLDDSLLMTLVSASVASSVQVVAMFPGRAICGEYVDHIRKTTGRNMANIRVINKKATSLTAQDLGERKIDVLMAEPYYISCEGMLPWRLLRFWYERTQLTSLLSDKAILVPCRASLRGVAVNMPDLWRSRRFIKSVEGFDHHTVNSVLGACGDLPSPYETPILPYAVWQCGHYEELTDVFTVMEFDFSHPIQTTQGITKAAVQRTGLCHGVVLWMDWTLDKGGSFVLSTGPAGGRPSYWKQGVKLLQSPVKLGVERAQQNSHSTPYGFIDESGTNNVMKIAGDFDCSTGDLRITMSVA